jgi:hypothetical protein
MAAFDPATLDRWRRLAVVDRDGVTVGTINEFYLDRETGHPTWALVNTGLFGATQTFVPLTHATEVSDGLQVPYEKSHIRDAPRVDPHDELTPDEEGGLFAHYGVEYQPMVDPDAEGGEGAASAPPDRADSDTADATEADAPAVAAAGPGEAAGSATDTTGPGGTGPAASQATGADASGAEPPGPVRAEPETAEGSEPVAGPDGDVGPRADAADPDARDDLGTEAAAAGGRDPETGAAGPGAGDGPRAVPVEPGTVEGAGAEPGAAAAPDEPQPGPGDEVPAEPGTAEPEDTRRDGPGAAWSELGRGDEEPVGTAPDPARPVAVEPGLPGSTATVTDPTPTTVERPVADAPDHPAEPPRPPDEAGWTPDAPAGTEEPEPHTTQPGAGDRWREANLSAEQERIAQTAPHEERHEERSPLERARRRLERLVGGGQSSTEADEVADREAAERARRSRLGLDEDDHRGR